MEVALEAAVPVDVPRRETAQLPGSVWQVLLVGGALATRSPCDRARSSEDVEPNHEDRLDKELYGSYGGWCLTLGVVPRMQRAWVCVCGVCVYLRSKEVKLSYVTDFSIKVLRT